MLFIYQQDGRFVQAEATTRQHHDSKMCTACGKACWFVRGSSAKSRVAYDLVSGAFHAWCLPRLCGSDDVSAESDFELEDTWEDGDDGD